MACAASWRKSHAQAYLEEPTGRAEPRPKPDAVPVAASQLPNTAPFQAPPKPTPKSVSRHIAVPSSDGEAVLPDTARPHLVQAPSALRSREQPAAAVAKQPTGVANEPVKPAKPAGDSASMRNEGGVRGGHPLAVSANTIQPVGVFHGEANPCTTLGGGSAVLDDQESRQVVKATEFPEENRDVLIDERRAVVEPAVDSGRKRRRFDEPCPANPTDDVVRASTRRKSSGDVPDEEVTFEHVDPTIAKRRPGERAYLPSLGEAPHRPRRIRASTGSVSTHSPLKGMFHAADGKRCTGRSVSAQSPLKSVFHDAEGKSCTGQRFSEDVLVAPSLLPANAQDRGRRYSSPGEGHGRRTVPSEKSASERQLGTCSQQTGAGTSGKAISERQEGTCSQRTEIHTSSDVAQACQPRPPKLVNSPPCQAAISSVKRKTEERLVDDIPVVAPPWMGRIGDCTSGQENPETPGHGEPSISAVAESNRKSPIRCQGSKGPGGEDEDAAMASKQGSYYTCCSY